MVGMRDRLIHGYFGIDYEIVWDVIKNIIPDLRGDIEQLNQSETNSQFAKSIRGVAYGISLYG